MSEEQQDIELKIESPDEPMAIVFSDEDLNEVGKFVFGKEGKFTFEGEADESANVFINTLSKLGGNVFHMYQEKVVKLEQEIDRLKREVMEEKKRGEDK